MWLKQVLRQEHLTDIARQKAWMQKGSIERFLQPRRAGHRMQDITSSIASVQYQVAVEVIRGWWRQTKRHRSNVEMPRMGIGNPG